MPCSFDSPACPRELQGHRGLGINTYHFKRPPRLMLSRHQSGMLIDPSEVLASIFGTTPRALVKNPPPQSYTSLPKINIEQRSSLLKPHHDVHTARLLHPRATRENSTVRTRARSSPLSTRQSDLSKCHKALSPATTQALLHCRHLSRRRPTPRIEVEPITPCFPPLQALEYLDPAQIRVQAMAKLAKPKSKQPAKP